MKHWLGGDVEYSQRKTKDICLNIGGDEIDADRVLAISITGGEVTFTEQCDEWYRVTTTPSIAIAALEEAISWIRANTKESPNS